MTPDEGDVGRPRAVANGSGRPDRASQRRVLGVVGAACLAVLLAAVAANVLISDDAGLVRSELAPEGSELGPDFVVPEGTSLVGARFPGRDEGSWTAVLLVEGDPFEVMRDLIDQSSAIGMRPTTQHFEGRLCTTQDGEISPASFLRCELYVAGQAPARDYAFLLLWGRNGDASYRHMLVYQRVGPPMSGVEISEVEIDLPPGPSDIGAWDPPAVGQPVVSPSSPLGEDPIVRESGSAVIAPPAAAVCGTGGYDAVLRIDGDVDDVFARYVEQFEGRRWDGETKESTFEGASVLEARYTTAGGGDLEAVAVSKRGSTPLLLLTRCND